MAIPAMNKAFYLLLPGLLAIGACGSGGTGGMVEAPLAGARIGGPFTLTNQNGKAVRWADFRGKYALVYFGYTYCPDVCPVDLQRIMAGYRLFEKAHPDRAARLRPVFITVDPERDTPAVLKPWVAAFDPRLDGLTGSPEAIEAVKKAFAVFASRQPNANSPDAYLVGHSRTPYLFAPDGGPIALVPVDDPATDADEASPELVADFFDQWVK